MTDVERTRRPVARTERAPSDPTRKRPPTQTRRPVARPKGPTTSGGAVPTRTTDARTKAPARAQVTPRTVPGSNGPGARPVDPNAAEGSLEAVLARGPAQKRALTTPRGIKGLFHVSPVPFLWTLRDILQGWRGVAMLVAAAIPALFLGLIWLVEGDLPSSQVEEIFAIITTAFIFPGLSSLMAIVAGGAVLRTAMEDGTAVYFLGRAEDRFRIGFARALAAASVVAVLCVVAVLFITFPLGQVRMFFAALPGLLVGGFAMGALYGLIISLHRFALGAALVHAVFESSVSRLPLGIRQWTISYHAWGWMGRTAEAASRDGVVPDTGGSGLVALLFAIGALLLTGLFFKRKQFHLGVAAEA